VRCDPAAFRADLFGRDFVVPGLLTLGIALTAQLAGIVLGFVLAVGRRSRIALFRLPSAAYIWFFRGTPVLIQIVFIYDGLAELTDNSPLLYPVTRHAVVAGIVALALNEAAYMAEIIRAGLLSVDRGQIEAARSLGMTSGLAMRRIILPQALRIIVPPTGNEFISMLKTTSLLEIISVPELFTVAQEHYSTDFRYFEPLATICVWYLAYTTLFTLIQSRVERRLNLGFLEHAMPRQVGAVTRWLGGGFGRGAR